MRRQRRRGQRSRRSSWWVMSLRGMWIVTDPAQDGYLQQTTKKTPSSARISLNNEVHLLRCPRWLCRRICPRPRGQDCHLTQRLRVRARCTASSWLLRSARFPRPCRSRHLRSSAICRTQARTYQYACIRG